MKLYLCEKPSQAQDIANALGNPKKQNGFYMTNDGLVTWAFGHLLELSAPSAYNPSLKTWSIKTIPFIPSVFKMEIKESGKAQFKIIKDLLKKANEVIIATDIDREGELIAREILAYCNYQGELKRLWFTALDEKSLKKAFQNPLDYKKTESLYLSALSRSRADWIVGLNMTRLMTILSQAKSVVSVGRIQTPTLALVVHRDNQFNNFTSRNYWTLTGSFSLNDGCTINLQCNPEEGERFYNKNTAVEIAEQLKGKQCELSVTKELKSKAPEKLFSLSSLQKKCNQFFDFSAAQTLSIAQSLYEKHKATTYPRSDCQYLPEEQLEDIPQIINNLKTIDVFTQNIEENKENLKGRKKIYNTAKVTAHHAIIPTTKHIDTSKLNSDEFKVFIIIASRFLANLMPDHKYKQTTIKTKISNLEFKAISNITTNSGDSK